MPRTTVIQARSNRLEHCGVEVAIDVDTNMVTTPCIACAVVVGVKFDTHAVRNTRITDTATGAAVLVGLRLHDKHQAIGTLTITIPNTGRIVNIEAECGTE